MHIAPVGEFVGSDAEGNPVPETITAEALQDIANNLNSTGTEVLADIDHGAAKPGINKDTSAAGWFTRFIVDPIKGLFASLKLTKRGKELLENREYRYISPTFTLDENGKPVELHTASLTNMPAFKGHIDPILNQEAEPISKTDEGIDNMTKEDLVALIKETVIAMNSAPEEVKDKTEVEETASNGCSEAEKTAENGCSEAEETVKNEDITEVEETASNGCSEAEKTAENGCSEAEETVKNEDITESETVEETVEETTENSCSEETKEEVKNEETEETKEEKKEEVIKLEALNSSPTALGDIKDSSWRNLHGKEFFDYLAKHPEIKG